jgi:hypothetical protein
MQTMQANGVSTRDCGGRCAVRGWLFVATHRHVLGWWSEHQLSASYIVRGRKRERNEQ